MLNLFRRITGKEKEFFARQLSIMLKAGLPLPRAIDTIYRQTRNPTFKIVLKDVNERLKEGKQLSQIFSKYSKLFPPQYIAAIKSGEATGKLASVFAELAKAQDEENMFRAGVLNALLYPLLIVIVVIVLGLFLVFQIIPQLNSVFAGQNVTLPWATRALIAVITFLNHTWLILIILIIVVIIVTQSLLKTSGGRLVISRLQLSSPVLRDLYTDIYVTRFARTLRLLIRHGIPIIDALEITQGTMNNMFFKASVQEMRQAVEKGLPLSKILIESAVFPPLAGQMAQVGEQSGKLDEALGELANQYKAETSQILKTLAALIEPILIIIVGLGVGYIVYAILTPIYQVAQII